LKNIIVKIAVIVFFFLIAIVIAPDIVAQISAATVKKLDQFLLLFSIESSKFIRDIRISREMIITLAVWIVIVLSMATIFTRVWNQRKKKDEDTPELPEIPPVIEETPEIINPSKGGDYNREVVVRFFLQVFKIQIGAMKSAPGKYYPVTSINVWPNKVYELSVFHEGDWVNRRLTIGPLGDEGVSKSICFYVIYDDHLVVKIPPEPINDFQEYMSSIKADRIIANRLAPKECVIPRVSVILGRLLNPGKANAQPDDIEKNFVERLNSNSQFQDYLKIGDTFAFFMDLSRYYFLSRIITEMHDMDNAMPQEILSHPQIIWDTYEFDGRYGRENAHIGFEMRNIYDEYEREINRLLLQYGVTTPLASYSMKNWFLIHLSGRGKIESEGDLSKSFIQDLNALSRESMIDNRVSIESYRRVIREFIYKSTIARFRVEMGSLVTNLLGILIWLGDQQVAMRDLKPDNLLIAGEPDRYPQFLRATDQYSIGLIDVETAVDYGKENLEDIIQPQLGGTPKYATPSHLFPNELISAIYSDLKRIFHFQDWYATVAMIFKVITGDTLFEKTAILLPQIKRMIESPLTEEKQLVSACEYVSRAFWKSSYEEFYEKIEKNRRILNTVQIVILENVSKAILRHLEGGVAVLSDRIRKRINEQSMFKSQQNKESLIHSSAEKISIMRRKCEKDEGERLSNKQEIIKFFKEFEQLKKQYEVLTRFLEMMKNIQSEIQVATLMEIMFNIVYSAMFTEVWYGFIDEETSSDHSENDGDFDETL
jgi:serine/threonine protein kinase